MIETRTRIVLSEKDMELYDKLKDNRSIYFSDLVRQGLRYYERDMILKKTEWMSKGYLACQMVFYNGTQIYNGKKKTINRIFSVKLEGSSKGKIVKPIRLIDIEPYGVSQLKLTYFIDGVQKESIIPESKMSNEILDLFERVSLAIDTLNKAN